jgi:tyrosine decarboxylase / aspartate 1-decarboxylase
MSWDKKEQSEIQEEVFAAIQKNKSYTKENVLGVPASYLDSKVFSQDDSILQNAPFLSALVNNPNHIGCHTVGSSESFFSGTHEIERKVIRICAEDILKGKPESFDGYVASGGTEANIQAIWIYRNYFNQEFNAKNSEIALICSVDSHYSMDKAANLLNIPLYKIDVDDKSRSLIPTSIKSQISSAKKDGIQYFIVVANMMTTMFGSVDDIDLYTSALIDEGVEFKVHIDGAYGGFYYPFSNQDNKLNFSNEFVSSVTLDAHKMAQAPYGTGIFIIRKGLIGYATTKEASYVAGEDSTLIGSRSGANAISIWMILSKYGPNGWMEKIFILQKRTEWLCSQLDELNVQYYRNKFSNIVTIDSTQIPADLVEMYGLVPDNHECPNWVKIVVMDHVSLEKMEPFIKSLKARSIMV